MVKFALLHHRLRWLTVGICGAMVLVSLLRVLAGADAQQSTVITSVTEGRSIAMTSDWNASPHPNAAGIPAVTIDAEVSVPEAQPGAPRITGKMRIEQLPPLALAEERLPLRLYPNAQQYGDASMTVSEVRVDGQLVDTTAEMDDTILWIPLEPRSKVVELTFQAQIDPLSTASFGIFSATPDGTTMLLGHWYPMLVPTQADGWFLDPIAKIGDPIFAPYADYQVSVGAPIGMTVVATGVRLTTDAIANVATFATGPVREVVLAISSSWVPSSVSVGETTVTAWAPMGLPDGGSGVADAAVAALTIFEGMFGPYPYRELDIVAYNLNGASGMEFPGVIVLSPEYWQAPLSSFAESVIAHEIAHQWWYGLVANNQYISPVLDEGLAQLAGTELYFEARYGSGRGDEMYESQAGRMFDEEGGLAGMLSPALPADAYPDMRSYFVSVYAGGGEAFHVLREQIGDDAFATGLKQILADHAFSTVSPDDYRSAWESACACELAAFWETWFPTP